MFSRKFVAALVAIALAQGTAQAQPVAAGESKVVVISPHDLSANQTEAFEEFKSNGRYFGAFYVSRSGGFSWRSNLNTLEAAKLLAFQGCNLENRNCQIYATLGPKSARLTKHIEGLSITNAASAETWLNEKAVGGRSAAVAANGYFGWAGWQGNLDPQRLRRSALNHCKDRQQSRLAKLDDNQQKALQREGLLNCSIIMLKKSR